MSTWCRLGTSRSGRGGPAAAGQHLEGRHPGWDDMQVQRPQRLPARDRCRVSGNSSPLSKNTTTASGADPAHQVENDEGVLTAGEGDVALVFVQVPADPSLNQGRVAPRSPCRARTSRPAAASSTVPGARAGAGVLGAWCTEDGCPHDRGRRRERQRRHGLDNSRDTAGRECRLRRWPAVKSPRSSASSTSQRKTWPSPRSGLPMLTIGSSSSVDGRWAADGVLVGDRGAGSDQQRHPARTVATLTVRDRLG